MHARIRMCTHTHTHTHTNTYAHTNTYNAHVRTHTHTHMHTCAHTHIPYIVLGLDWLGVGWGGGLFLLFQCCCYLEVFLQELNTSVCVNQQEACLSRCAYQQHSSCRDSKFQRDTGTCVLKDKDITALFTHEERGMGRGSAGQSSWKDEKVPPSVRPVLELFERQHWGHF